MLTPRGMSLGILLKVELNVNYFHRLPQCAAKTH